MKKVPAPKVVTTSEAIESPLPPQIQEALGELLGAAREGLLALSVGVGLGVVHELMEREVDEVVGPKGKWNPDRAAKRHGHEDGSMTLGGRRVQVRRLDDVRLAVMMLDGIEIAERTHVVALGISTDGVKIPLGLWEGSTENATLARTLLADLVDRGLDPEQAILFVIDGGKALRRAINDVFGEHALVHGCHRHKERNVCELLPERDRDTVRARMRAAWALSDPELARQRLELLATELDQSWPDAAGSLREGMHDTLTLMRLGITGQLAKTLCSTNPCESMLEIVRYTQRNVKRWQDGDMRKRWTAAGMLVAEQQFRRVIGYRDLAQLVIAIDRHAILVAP